MAKLTVHTLYNYQISVCAPIDDDLVLSEDCFQYINTKRERS